MNTSTYRVFLLLCILLQSCTRDVEIPNKEYPLLVTGIRNVSPEGAVLSADLVRPGKSRILEYGFVWSKEQRPTLSAAKKLFYEEMDNAEFSFTIHGGLEKSTVYFVRSYVKTELYEAYGNEVSFLSQGSMSPGITGFYPTFGPIGTQVVITGENFNSDANGNLVKFGRDVAVVVSATQDTLIVRVPDIPVPETKRVNISVQTFGMDAISSDSFDLWLPWLKLGNQNLPINPYNSANFVIDKKGYFFTGTDLIEFDPENNTFKPVCLLPEVSYSGILATASSSHGYVVIGNNLYSFDPVQRNFTFISTVPLVRVRREYIFCLNNEVYVGTVSAVNGEKNAQYKYNDVTKTWEARKEPFLPEFVYETYYSYHNEGILIFNNWGIKATIYKYDPIQDTWSFLSESPVLSPYGFHHFLIGDKIYAGFGYHPDIYSSNEYPIHNEFWQYDLSQNNWIKMHDRSKNLSVVISMTINGKGYILCDRVLQGTWGDLAYEYWEYDPAMDSLAFSFQPK
jgi:hypothetical protein